MFLFSSTRNNQLAIHIDVSLRSSFTTKFACCDRFNTIGIIITMTNGWISFSHLTAINQREIIRILIRRYCVLQLTSMHTGCHLVEYITHVCTAILRSHCDHLAKDRQPFWPFQVARFRRDCFPFLDVFPNM